MTLSPAVRQILLTPNYVRRWGVISRWSMDEASNGVRFDSVGGNHLTDNNTVPMVAGKIGGAASFVSGNNERLTCASNSALQTGNQSTWIAAWINPSVMATSKTVATKGQASANREWQFAVTSGDRATMTVYDGTTAASIGTVTGPNPSMVLDTWSFWIAYIDFDAALVGISVNGGAWTTGAITGSLTVGNESFQISGRSSTSQIWDGMLDEVVLGKNPPTGLASVRDEIRNRLYNGGSGRRFPWR